MMDYASLYPSYRCIKNQIDLKRPDNRLSTVAAAFAKSFDANLVKVISVSDQEFHIQGTRCPFGLENTSRELCEAVIRIDHAYFRAAVSDNQPKRSTGVTA